MQQENIESIYPLTDVQHGMLFHVNYDHRSSVYVESLAFKIRGNLDVNNFKAAWAKVLARHSALRTFFVWKNRDNPLQIVRKQVDLPWKELDWQHLSGQEQQEQLAKLIKSDQDQGYVLSKAPLMRLILVQLDSGRYQLIWSYHHIIIDGWSVGLVIDEVFSIYNAMQENLEANLQHAVPFQNYVSWLKQQDLSTAEGYWRKNLQGFFDTTPINIGDPPDMPDAEFKGFGSQDILLSSAVTSGLQSITREHRITMNTVTQGAWALLLSRYSGEQDVLFGAAVAGRSGTLPGIENMVGMIIGSLPVRVQISPQASLIPWLQDIQAQQFESRSYEYSSLKNILTWSEMNRSRGQTLFDSIQSFNNYEFDNILEQKRGNLEISDVSFVEGSHYPLTMLIDPGEQLRIKINFDRQRFAPSAIKRLLEQLAHLLADFAADPSRQLSAYASLSAFEEQSLLVDFNQTQAALPDRLVLQLFEDQAQISPDAVALRYQDRVLTYAQLDERANQLANHLLKRGIGAESVVALCLDRSPEVIIAILGTFKAGAAYMPIDTALPEKRVAWMLEETKAQIILSTQKFVHRLPASDAETIFLDSQWADIAGEAGSKTMVESSLEDLAYIIYTSGSTGKPKGAMVRQGNLLNYISWAKDYYLKGEQLDFPLFSSLSFDLTVTSIFLPLVSGACLVVYPEDESSSLSILDVFRDNLVDMVKLTPAHLALVKELDLQGSRIRKMIVGGEDFKRSLAFQISELFDHQVEIYNEYGPTEATVGCMIHRFDTDADQASSVPIGRPIKNTQIYILDQHLNPVPTGVTGEMCIGGSSVARGYIQQPQLSAEKFVDDPFQPGSKLYRTGDLARWTESGQMQFLGRADHQVKIQGYRVELGEIESSLLDHPAIDAAVLNVVSKHATNSKSGIHKCVECGLPDNYPGVSFDAGGVCNTCREFNVLKDRFQPYFKTPEDLRELLERAKVEKSGNYDCIVLYSGGKDSSYMLYQLVRTFGVNPLVFSIDNGYISEEAKVNIRRVTEDLGVDLVFGQTPHMNAVFVDSLKRHSNVCDGCFKVIYTLSINLAKQRGIKYIFTGLTRGQLFETRLSDMFKARIFDVDLIDQTVLSARKAYHRFDDAVSQLMDVEIFADEKIFDEVQLVDFFRYTDVPLQEMYQYLEDNAPWVRPSDSGRSTNCLINDVGIYIHKKERGYHNYALPYSWDVRMGHKTRQEALDDLDDRINESRVQEILQEIGYDESEQARIQLAAYYVSQQPVTPAELREHLANSLPAYMLPNYFIELDQLPLTHNGKIDRQALPTPEFDREIISAEFVAPETEVEEHLALIWQDVLNVNRVGIHDNFFELGGDSIATIQVMMRISKVFQIDLLPFVLFNSPTIAELATRIEEVLLAEIEALTDDEAELLLSQLDDKQG
jgi:amino acid adenylation domain-containing protein